MSKAKNPKSRWVRGNARYTKDVDLSKYREQHGWRNGARLRKR